MNKVAAGVAVEKMLFNALEALKQGDIAPWIEMFHDDGVMEFPYAPPGNPTRLGSKAEIAEYMQGYSAHLSLKQVENRGTYYSDGVIIVEFRSEGVAVPTGNLFTMDYVAIISYRDGSIKLYRDYWNPLVALQAMGHAGTLLGSKQEMN